MTPVSLLTLDAFSWQSLIVLSKPSFYLARSDKFTYDSCWCYDFLLKSFSAL